MCSCNVLLKVRKYLHVCLCFSPVGDTFRVRARQFPALVSCCQIGPRAPPPAATPCGESILQLHAALTLRVAAARLVPRVVAGGADRGGAGDNPNMGRKYGLPSNMLALITSGCG